MIEVVGTVISLVGGSASTLAVSSRVADFLRTHAGTSSEAEDVRTILGLRSRAATIFRHDSVHPLYPSAENPHPDNTRALAAAAGADYARALNAGRVRETPTDPYGDITSNLVLIGGATSEGLTRVLFGYTADADDPGSLVATTPPLELPYQLILDANAVDPSAVARRIVPGQGWVARPNWRIEGNGGNLVPELGDNGELLSDYLLVTSIPNLTSDAAEHTGHRIVTIAGTHGTGTRAVELLTRDKVLLTLLREQLSPSDVNRPFQLVFRADRIKHDPARGTHATRVTLAAEPIFLSSRSDIWDTARTVMRSNLRRGTDSST